MKRILSYFAFTLLGIAISIALLFWLSKDATIDTRMNLIMCAFAVQEYRITNGKWPAAPDGLGNETSVELGMGGGVPLDEWGRRFVLEIDPEADHATLGSYGQDGKPGGNDGDIKVRVTPKQLAVSSE
jgi:hypothetical protein